jgi:uncharacterized protein YqhQ
MGWSRRFSHLVSLFLTVVKAPLLIGGQAVMEGVMMKSKHHLATAVRSPKGKMVLHHQTQMSFAERHRLDKVPFLRGIIMLVETLIIGMRELNWSANQALGDDEEKPAPWTLGVVFLVSILFALALFKLLPFFLAKLLTNSLAGPDWTLMSRNWMLNILDGVIKFAIFISYILLITLLPDVRRLFEYHGAEHKSVNCYEAGERLTPKHAKRHTKKQPRCGTTFVVYVFVLSVFVYIFIPLGSSFWTNYLLRLLLLPLIAGIAYEWIRFAGRCYSKSVIVRWVSAPGMAVQSLTTREPDLKQLAVAIAALKRVLSEERRQTRSD